MGAALLAAVLLIPAGAVAAQTTREEVLTHVETSPEVQRALLAHEAAVRELHRVALGGDPQLQVSPGVRFDGSSGDLSPERWNLSLTVSGTLPLGLTDEQQTRVDRARDAVARAEITLEQTRREVEVRLERLFIQGWITREEVRLLEREVAVQEEYMRVERLRFARGDLSWEALLRGETALRNAVADLAGAEAVAREALLDLALGIQREPHLLGELVIGDLGTGDREITGMGDHGIPSGDTPGAVAARELQDNALAAALREAAERPSVLSSVSLRLGADFPDHSASATWSPTGQTVSLAYTPRVGIFAPPSGTGSSGGSSSTTDWTISLGVTLGLAGTTGAAADQRIREVQVSREELQRSVLDMQLLADREARAAQVERADRAVESARAALERAEVAYRIVAARRESGGVRDVDLQLADLELERAAFAVRRAQLVAHIARQEFYL